jgi:hypothetical protein
MIKELRKTNTDISRECQQLKMKEISDRVMHNYASHGSAESSTTNTKTLKVDSIENKLLEDDRRDLGMTFGIGKRVRQTADKKSS